MTNVGVINGLTPGTWRRYKPQWICVGGVNPVTVNEFDVQGEYLIRANGIVSMQMQVALGPNPDAGTLATVGSGGPYAWQLPIPAWRPSGPNTSCPMPLGSGMAYLNFNSSPNPDPQMDLTPTLLDPNVTIDDPDYWFQAFSQYVMDWGTGTWAVSTSSKTINHNIGFAFNPEDIEFVNTSSSGSAWWPPFVSNITSTQFTMNSRGAINQGNNLTYAYKIKALPQSASSALAGPNVPYHWGYITSLGPFGHFFFHLNYMARR